MVVLLLAACLAEISQAAAQAHATPVTHTEPATPAPHGPPAPGPATELAAPAALPAPAALATPAPAAKPPAATPVKLGEVRGRINAALAAMPPAPAPAPRSRAAAVPPSVATPRVAVVWPVERWTVEWPGLPDRVTLVWPD